MRKKDIVLLVVCVLLLSTFSVIVAFPIANCSAAVIDVIYVDDDNTEGPWDGTLEHPYQYIQDGLDNANPGDAVFVFNGTYNEEVTINKTVDLIGEDKNGTFVNGTDYGFIITADWVNLSGFSVYNALSYPIYLIDSSHCVIFDCDLYDSYETIVVLEADTKDCSYNTIRNCEIHEGDRLINIWTWGSKNITYNQIHNNTMHTCNQFGFELYNAYNNTIRNNTIIHYPWAEGGGGSRSDNAIYLWSSHYNNISNNEISNWDATSIYFETYEDSEGNYSNYNVIWENNITNNTVGIEIHSGENNSIFYNNFYNTFNAYDYSSANNNFSYNWWENYDEPSEGAWDNDSNGIADDPYDISGLAGNSDRYPLMVPYELWTPPEDSPEPCNTSVEFYVVLANEKVQIKDDVVIKSGDVGVNGECADITLPPFPSFTPGSDDINVRRKKIYTLDEGDYGDITIGRRGKLIFTGGIYNINTLTTRNNVELVFLDRSEVHINNRLIIGKNCKVGPDIGSSVSASDIILYIKGADTVNIGRGGILNANIYAPNGTILLRRNVEATGSFIGKIVNIRSGVQLELDSAFK